jgi:UDP-N-acetylglucosamine 2-epimerase (non-hydrolysing)
LGAALAAYDCAVPIGHIEAGLRSGDRRQPWPEEDNRVLIDRMADLLFAPTPSAATNLARERDARGRIFVTGNTGIDALLLVRPAQRQPTENSCKTILVTCHRRENQGARLPAVAAALKRIAAELPVEILFVLHSNPRLRRTVQRLLGGAPNVALIEPLGHSEMVGLMDRSWLILTDSGGIQEEAPYLGLPVLVLRDRTERVEALAAGNAELVGTRSENIYKAVARLLQDESLYGTRARPRFPFGDGHAAPRIARAVEAYFGGATRSPELGRCAEQPGTFS